MLYWFDWSEFMTFAISDMKRTKRRGPRTEQWGTPVSMMVEGEDDEHVCHDILDNNNNNNNNNNT